MVVNTTKSEIVNISAELKNIATVFKMRNHTSNSRVENTLLYYAIPWDQGHWYFGIGCREQGDDTIIDLFGRSHGAKVRPYRDVENRVETF